MPSTKVASASSPSAEAHTAVMLELGKVCDGSDTSVLIDELQRLEGLARVEARDNFDAAVEDVALEHGRVVRAWLVAANIFETVVASSVPEAPWRAWWGEGGVVRIAAPLLSGIVKTALERVAFHFPAQVADASTAPALPAPEHFFDFVLQEEDRVRNALLPLVQHDDSAGGTELSIYRVCLQAWGEGITSLFTHRYGRFLRRSEGDDADAVRPYLLHTVNVVANFSKAHWGKHTEKDSVSPGVTSIFASPDVCGRWMASEVRFLEELLYRGEGTEAVFESERPHDWRREQLQDTLTADASSLDTLPYTNGLPSAVRLVPWAIDAATHRCRPLLCTYATGSADASERGWEMFCNRVVCDTLRGLKAIAEEAAAQRCEGDSAEVLLRCVVGPFDFVLEQFHSLVLPNLRLAVSSTSPVDATEEADATTPSSSYDSSGLESVCEVLDDIGHARDRAVREVIAGLKRSGLRSGEMLRHLSRRCSFATWERIETAATES